MTLLIVVVLVVAGLGLLSRKLVKVKSTTEPAQPIFQRPLVRLAGWLCYLCAVFYYAVTPYATFVFVTATIVVGCLHWGWKRQKPTQWAKRLFVRLPIPALAVLLAAAVSGLTPYAYRETQEPDMHLRVRIRTDRWNGCTWSLPPGSNENTAWDGPICPTNNEGWLPYSIRQAHAQ